MATETILMPREDGVELLKPCVSMMRSRKHSDWKLTLAVVIALLFATGALVVACLTMVNNNKLTLKVEKLCEALSERADVDRDVHWVKAEGLKEKFEEIDDIREDEEEEEETEAGSGQLQDANDEGTWDDEDFNDDGEDTDDFPDEEANGGRGKRSPPGGSANGNGQKRKKNKGHKTKSKLNKAQKKLIQKAVHENLAKKFPLSPIHLEGNVSVTQTEETQLCESESHFTTQPWWHGKMYCQGFVPGNESLAFWKVADWVSKYPGYEKDYAYHPDKGAVEVRKTGLYYVYAQVHFHETKGHLGYHVNTTRHSTNEVRTLFTCITGVDYVASHENGKAMDSAKYKACSTNGLAQLSSGDRVFLAKAAPNLKLETQPYSTFWGMIRIH